MLREMEQSARVDHERQFQFRDEAAHDLAGCGAQTEPGTDRDRIAVVGEVAERLDRTFRIAIVEADDDLLDEVRAQQIRGIIRRRDRHVAGA